MLINTLPISCKLTARTAEKECVLTVAQGSPNLGPWARLGFEKSPPPMSDNYCSATPWPS